MENLFFKEWSWEMWGILSLVFVVLSLWISRNIPDISEELIIEDRRHRREWWQQFFKDHGDGMGAALFLILFFTCILSFMILPLLLQPPT